MKTKTELRKENNEFIASLYLKRAEMKDSLVPKHHYLPAINRFVTAGQIALAVKAIRNAYIVNPDTEFKHSFSSWAPKTAKDILHWEVLPMIHERINIRGLIKQS